MTAPARLFLERIDTPIGGFSIVTDEEGRLRTGSFGERGHVERELAARGVAGPFVLVAPPSPTACTAAMERYFAGELSAIDALSVSTSGTPFQASVWSALREIPCGATWSYSDLARRIGNPAAVRAVGLANGANPIAVVVPCHRVIGADGSLTGYAGGIERKRWLLAHEGALPAEQLSLGATFERPLARSRP